jgi:hypothetical protein
MEPHNRNKKMRRKTWENENLFNRANRALLQLRSSNTPQADRVHRIFGLYTRMMHDWGYSTDSASQVLNHHLSRYRWENLLTLDLKPYSRPAPDVIGEDFNEYYAIRAFLDLAATENGLSRVKLCPQCSEWFIAVRRGDQRFCSGACKQKNFYSDPKKREEQRKRMKDNYAIWKTQKANPRSGVGLGTSKGRRKTAQIDILAG